MSLRKESYYLLLKYKCLMDWCGGSGRSAELSTIQQCASRPCTAVADACTVLNHPQHAWLQEQLGLDECRQVPNLPAQLLFLVLAGHVSAHSRQCVQPALHSAVPGACAAAQFYRCVTAGPPPCLFMPSLTTISSRMNATGAGPSNPRCCMRSAASMLHDARSPPPTAQQNVLHDCRRGHASAVCSLHVLLFNPHGKGG